MSSIPRLLSKDEIDRLPKWAAELARKYFAGEASLEVEIFLDAVAVGPHLPHGFGAENILEDGGVDCAGRHGTPFRLASRGRARPGHPRLTY